MFKAISFGVFCREAPSTSLIIRSKNVSPGFEVIRTLISSESTRVPPVTAERSPPDSRITGADSPVIADSSTDATPSITSPSPGINSPAATTTTSPARSFELATISVLPSSRNLCASVSARALRSVSACAFPRPSAMASAKFANSTVNHSQSVICNPNQYPPVCRTRFAGRTTSVITAPTSTTNITGFLHITRGSNFQKESTIAVFNIFWSVIAAFFACAVVILSSKRLSCVHKQVLQNRPQTQRWEESQCPNDQNNGDQQYRKQRPRHRKCPQRFRHVFLRCKISRNRENGNNHEEPPKQHRHAKAGVVPERIRAQSGKRRAVIAHGGGVGIQNLRQPVRAGIGYARRAKPSSN